MFSFLCLPLEVSPTVSSHFALQIHHHWWWVRNIIRVQKAQCTTAFKKYGKEKRLQSLGMLNSELSSKLCQPRRSAQRITVVWQVMNEWFSGPQAPSQERQTKLEDYFSKHGGWVTELRSHLLTSTCMRHDGRTGSWLVGCSVQRWEKSSSLFILPLWNENLLKQSKISYLNQKHCGSKEKGLQSAWLSNGG